MHEIDPSWQMLYLSHAFQTEILLQDLRFRSCSPTLCVPSFKNNTWNLKLGGSFDNTLCTNPKENSTK